MLTRIITGIVALAIFVPVCIFSDTVIFPIAFAILAMVAVGEVWHCVRGENPETKYGKIGHPLLYIPAYIIAGATMFTAYYFSADEPDVFGYATMALTLLLGAFMVLLLYLFAVTVFSKGKIAIDAVAVFYLMTFYVTCSFASVMFLRSMDGGQYLYLLPFIGAWVSDTFAYFTGRAIGKHKLIPEVSPKKTIEGSIGGIVFTAIAYVVYALLLNGTGTTSMNIVGMAVTGGIISGISQIGDLSASVVKRHYGIKDYGKLFPGHGGVLDRFDSVLATAPVLFLLHCLNII